MRLPVVRGRPKVERRRFRRISADRPRPSSATSADCTVGSIRTFSPGRPAPARCHVRLHRSGAVRCVEARRASRNVHLLGARSTRRSFPATSRASTSASSRTCSADYTANVYPTKLNEYLAMGKPVVATESSRNQALQPASTATSSRSPTALMRSPRRSLEALQRRDEADVEKRIARRTRKQLGCAPRSDGRADRRRTGGATGAPGKLGGQAAPDRTGPVAGEPRWLRPSSC